ncbi:MAG: DUF190 domain-containing protein [Candidatus Limnocylindrales bacterium]
MRPHSRGLRVQVFVGEADQAGRIPRYEAILEYLRREGAAGATVVRGVAGFGVNSKIHTAAILRLSMDLPMILTWVDAPGRVERLLPGLVELAGSGVVTVEEVGVAAYGGRRLDQLRFDLLVVDVMTRSVVSIDDAAPVRTAVGLLLDRDFRALPVVDRDRRVVGLVTNGDLVRRGKLGARLELLAAMTEESRASVLEHLDAQQTVRDVMSVDPTTIPAGATLAEATHLMADRHLKRVPVVDDDGRLIGILARSDVLRAVGETFPREGAAHEDHAGAQTVGEIMRHDAPIVLADAELGTLLDAVTSTRLNRAVIVDADDRVLGVVSDADIIASVDPAAANGLLGALMRAAGRPTGSGLTAARLIRRPLVTIAATATIAEAARLMIDERRKVLSVTDSSGRLLGIVDRADLLAATGEALWELTASPADDDDGG